MDDDVRVILKKERIHRNRSTVLQSSGKVVMRGVVVHNMNIIIIGCFLVHELIHVLYVE